MNKNIENLNKSFIITRVVTRHFASDFFQGVRNILGLRLRSYEKVIKEAHKEVTNEMNKIYGNSVNWYRISFNPLINASIMVTLYGELK